MLRTGADPTGGGAPYPLKAPAVCVVGSTASGKTDLAQALALEPVSYTHLDVYKRQDYFLSGLLQFGHNLYHMV